MFANKSLLHITHKWMFWYHYLREYMHILNNSLLALLLFVRVICTRNQNITFVLCVKKCKSSKNEKNMLTISKLLKFIKLEKIKCE